MNRQLRIWLPAIRARSGADVFVQRLALGLQRAGHVPCVQWFDHSGEWMPWRLMAASAPAGTDVIHANSWQGFAFRRAGIPLVVTEHQYVAHPSFAPYRSTMQALYHSLYIEKCVRRSYMAADAIVAVSDFCATAMRKDVAKPLSVIHNWVDTEQFLPKRPASRDDRLRSKSDDPYRLLFVGNPSRWKGADLLPTIASQLGSDFELQCIGGLRADFDAKHLPANLKLLPRMEPVGMPSVYQSVDAVLVPTRYEAFGYVALEAMACGLPVLGFKSAGTAEVCEHGKTAFLAKTDDVQQLVKYARQLSEDRSLGAEMGSAGRRRAMEYFGEPRAVANYLNVYKQVLERGPKSA